MKKSIFAILSLALMLTLGSCAKENTMEGTWQATSAKVEAADMNPLMTTLVQEEYQMTNLIIKPEGGVELRRGNDVMAGTYTMDDATKTLKMASAADAPNPWSEEYTVKSQTPEEMTLTQAIDAKGSMVTLVLQKQKAPAQEGQQ